MSDEHGGETEGNDDATTSNDGDGDGDEDTGDGDEHTADTDNGLSGCAANGTVGECMAQPGCAPVFGQPLVEDGIGGWCTDATQLYLGCVSTLELCPFPECDQPCPGGDAILCEGDSYWLTAGCVPDNLMVCATPGPLSGDC